MHENINKTLKQLLKDREYELDSELEHKSVAVHSKTHEKLTIIFIYEQKLGIQVVKVIENILIDTHVNHAIVVYENSITPCAKSGILSLINDGDGYNIEMFTSLELMYNVNNHHLVPKHTILDADEKKEVLQFFKVTDKRLPYIMQSDPIARYFGAKVGTMFRIDRDEFQSVPYYRVVVA